MIGCGWSGSLAAYNLAESGFKVDVYEQEKKPKVVCACGIPTDFLIELARDHGLNPEDYIFWKSKNLTIRFSALTADLKIDNLCTFNKQRFIEDLIDGSSATFHFRRRIKPKEVTGYDLVIDATGTRSILGRQPWDRFALCYQVKARFTELPYQDFYMDLSNPKSRSYLWLFPLSERTAYVGSASQNGSPKIQVERFIKEFKGEILKREGKTLRLNPPSKSLPFYRNRVVGVGNSIGAITSLGEGNAPSALTVKILMQNINDPEGYRRNILKELGWIEHDHAVYNALINNKRAELIYHSLKLIDVYRERFKIKDFGYINLKIIPSILKDNRMDRDIEDTEKK